MTRTDALKLLLIAVLLAIVLTLLVAILGIAPPAVEEQQAGKVYRVGYLSLAEFEELVGDHRPHGPLSVDATEPAWNGYLLTVACSCGVLFGRWVTPMDAELDLLRAATLN